jgi:hypothetical protein
MRGQGSFPHSFHNLWKTVDFQPAEVPETLAAGPAEL